MAAVNAVADSGFDIVKIRVDDNLGAAEKMTPEVYQAVVETAHHRGLKLAAHLYYLEDAKGLLEAGADLVAHSVRDADVDDALITLLRDSGVCVCPTLMREVSTYVYESRPDFFDDPFFLRDAIRVPNRSSTRLDATPPISTCRTCSTSSPHRPANVSASAAPWAVTSNAS